MAFESSLTPAQTEGATSRRVQDMKKTFAALVAAATIAGALAATHPSAQRGVAAGVASGAIGGAFVGGAIAVCRTVACRPVISVGGRAFIRVRVVFWV